MKPDKRHWNDRKVIKRCVKAAQNLKVPCGTLGGWTVKEIIVDAEGAKRHNFHVAVRGGRRYIDEGTYMGLFRGREVVMSSTPAEIADLYGLFDHAYGRVLVNGLGLGVALAGVLANREVTAVTVIESSPDVIQLVGPTFTNDPRVTIIEANAFEYQPPRGARYEAVWHDIWDNICTDNLKGITQLKRRYGHRAEWQGAWCEATVKYNKRRGR